MHKYSILQMQWFIDNFASNQFTTKDIVRILDVGSYDVNGSYRPLFKDKKYHYTGLDLEAGPNVDIVLKNPYDWTSIDSDSFDIVISGQALEHVEFFWKTMEEMARVLKNNGLLCIIAPNDLAEHRYPVDCYRFYGDGMVALARYVGLEPLHAHAKCSPKTEGAKWYKKGLADAVLIAKKTFDGPARHPDFKTYTCIPTDQKVLRNGLIPYQSTWSRLEKLKKRYFPKKKHS